MIKWPSRLLLYHTPMMRPKKQNLHHLLYLGKYSVFEHSDWPESFKQPIIMLKMSLAKIYAQNYLWRNGSRPTLDKLCMRSWRCCTLSWTWTTMMTSSVWTTWPKRSEFRIFCSLFILKISFWILDKLTTTSAPCNIKTFLNWLPFRLS